MMCMEEDADDYDHDYPHNESDSTLLHYLHSIMTLLLLLPTVVLIEDEMCAVMVTEMTKM